MGTPARERSSYCPGDCSPAMPEDLLSRAGMAYAHELSFMVCFAALTAERLMIRPDPDQGTATKLIITDIIYGLTALTSVGQSFSAPPRAGPSTVATTQPEWPKRSP